METITFLNVFIAYYRQLFRKPKNYNMLEDIDTDHENSTNRCMEFIYEAKHRYAEKLKEDETFGDIYEVDALDINETEELFILMINGKQDKSAKCLVPLIKYVSGMDDWYKMNWKIIPLKALH